MDTMMVRVVDTVLRVVDSPPDIEYEVDTTGHAITWNASDDNPLGYHIYINDTLVVVEQWDGSPITISVGGLDLGTYNYTIVVFDIAYNVAADTVTVRVVDTVPPTVDHPADIQYVEGEDGRLITWTPFDAHLARYEIFKNGSLVVSSSWGGDTISIDVDGLSPGVYNFTVVVYDWTENSVSDTVIVTVLQSTTTTSTVTSTTTSSMTTTTSTTPTTGGPAMGGETVIVIAGAAAAAVMVVVILVVLERRGGA